MDIFWILDPDPHNNRCESATLLENQCCGSGIIYSGSGSNFEFYEYQIRIPIQAKVPDPCGSGSNPHYLSIFGNCKKHTINSIIKKNLSTICHFLFHNTVLQYTVHSPEFTEKLHFYLSALSYFAGSRSGTIIPDPSKSSGSHADPDPHHCKAESIKECARMLSQRPCVRILPLNEGTMKGSRVYCSILLNSPNGCLLRSKNMSLKITQSYSGTVPTL